MRFSQMTLSELCDFAAERGVDVEVRHWPAHSMIVSGEVTNVGPFWDLLFRSRGSKPYSWAVRADHKDHDLDRCPLEEIIGKVTRKTDAA